VYAHRHNECHLDAYFTCSIKVVELNQVFHHAGTDETQNRPVTVGQIAGQMKTFGSGLKPSDSLLHTITLLRSKTCANA
jgi:hypothetical protein